MNVYEVTGLGKCICVCVSFSLQKIARNQQMSVGCYVLTELLISIAVIECVLTGATDRSGQSTEVNGAQLPAVILKSF